MTTLEELKEWLATTYDECGLIDLLDLSTFELVEFLEDPIENQFDKLIAEMEALKEEEDIDEDRQYYINHTGC